MLAGGGAAALALAGLLTGCGAGSAKGSGRFRAAFTAGGSQETLDPHVAPNFVDQARAKALFDTLATYRDDMSVRRRLAESWESDDGVHWHIRLRHARFHDNSPLTARDVLYSYRRVADPKTGSPSQPLLSAVDFHASRAHGDRELTLVLHRPDFEFPTAFAGAGTEIVPDGTTHFRHPVGSGPFRYASFEPGGTARFRRWEGHWAGAPRVAELEFVPANEESARVNALLSGQVHYAGDLSGPLADRVRSSHASRVLTWRRATAQQLLLRTGRHPFSDARLIRAVALGLDREALVRVALAGQGGVGNDLFGRGLRGYPDDLPAPRRDVDRARALVREAGAEGRSVPLMTSTVDATWDSASSLIAHQLHDIGLRITPHSLASTTYFSQITKKGEAALNTTSTLPVSDFLQQRLRSDAARNATGYHSDDFDRLLSRARGTRDEKKRLELLSRAQHLARKESGVLVWGFSDAHDGLAASVRGMREGPPNSHDWARFDRVEVE